MSYFSNVTSTYYMEIKLYIYIYMGVWLSDMLDSYTFYTFVVLIF